MYSEKALNFISNPMFFGAILFNAPRSPQWPLVRSLCLYADGIAEEKTYFIAAFKKHPDSLKLLRSICDMVNGWKTAHIFIQKTKIEYIYSIKWLNCYLQSLQCVDSKAWCLSITKAPRRLNESNDLTLRILVNTNGQLATENSPEQCIVRESYICPCKVLSAYNWGYRELPSSLKNQFEAFAVERGVADCPNFEIELFTPVFSFME